MKLKQYFNQVAEANFGRYTQKGSLPDKAQAWSRAVITNWLNQELTRSVLDLGCGRGDLLKGLENKDRLLSGVDISEEMIRQAKKQVKSGKFYLLDMSDLKRIKNHDAVICLNTLHHLSHNKLKNTLIQMRLKAKKIIILEIKNPVSIWAPIMWFDLKFIKKIPVYLHQPKTVVQLLGSKWELRHKRYLFKLPFISPYCLYEFKKIF